MRRGKLTHTGVAVGLAWCRHLRLRWRSPVTLSWGSSHPLHAVIASYCHRFWRRINSEKRPRAGGAHLGGTTEFSGASLRLATVPATLRVAVHFLLPAFAKPEAWRHCHRPEARATISWWLPRCARPEEALDFSVRKNSYGGNVSAGAPLNPLSACRERDVPVHRGNGRSRDE